MTIRVILWRFSPPWTFLPLYSGLHDIMAATATPVEDESVLKVNGKIVGYGSFTNMPGVYIIAIKRLVVDTIFNKGSDLIFILTFTQNIVNQENDFMYTRG